MSKLNVLRNWLSRLKSALKGSNVSKDLYLNPYELTEAPGVVVGIGTTSHEESQNRPLTEDMPPGFADVMAHL